MSILKVLNKDEEFLLDPLVRLFQFQRVPVLLKQSQKSRLWPVFANCTYLGGAIIFTSSLAGLTGVYGLSAYCGSKFAIRGYAESLAMGEKIYSVPNIDCNFNFIYLYFRTYSL